MAEEMQPGDTAGEVVFHVADSDAPDEIMRWEADGRLFWRGREVETDDEFRQMVRDMHAWMSVCMCGQEGGTDEL